MEDQRRQTLNLQSLTHARGWAGLFNGLGGKSSKVSPADLLPFPDDVDQGAQYELRPSTQRTLTRLIKQERLPPQVVSVAYMIKSIRDVFNK